MTTWLRKGLTMDTQPKSPQAQPLERIPKRIKAFLRLPDLSPQEKLDLLLLHAYGKRIFPGQGTIAKQMGRKSTVTVRAHLNSLKEKGIIKRWKRMGFNKTNEYIIDYELINELIERNEKLRSDSKKSDGHSERKLTDNHIELINNKIHIQEEFIFRYIEKNIPTLTGEEINKVLRTYWKKYANKNLIEIVNRVSEKTGIENLCAYILGSLRGEEPTEPEAILYSLRETIYWDFFLEKDYHETPLEKLAKHVHKNELNVVESTIRCEGCGLYGVTAPMLYFSYNHRDGSILCGKCSEPEKEISDLEQRS